MAQNKIGDKLVPDAVGQRNPAWANKKLGFSSSTLGGYGCLMTAFGMLCGKNTDEMNEAFKSHNLFVQQNLAATFDIRKAGAMGVSAPTYLGRWNDPVPEETLEQIREHLRKPNGYAIFEVDISTRPALQQHFVTGIGVDSNGIVINDPWYGDTVSLSPRYGRTDGIAIYRAWLYTKTQ